MSAPAIETTLLFSLSLSGYWSHELLVWLIIKETENEREKERLIIGYALTEHIQIKLVIKHHFLLSRVYFSCGIRELAFMMCYL